MIKTKELMTYEQVAAFAGVTESKVRMDRTAEHIHAEDEQLPKVRFTREEAKEYAEWVASKGNLKMDFDMTQPYKFLPASPRVNKIFGDPKKYSGGKILAISKNGEFINAARGKKITPYQSGHGHLQIALGNGLQPMAHDLVNLVWNDNAKYKPIVHHINGNKTDNRACNLISLFDDEHKLAHRLLAQINVAKSKEDKTAARKEYRDFIKRMRADNKEKIKEDLRVIDHLDYPSDLEHCNYMFVTEQSWQKHQNSGNESDIVIRGEYFGYNDKPKKGREKS